MWTNRLVGLIDDEYSRDEVWAALVHKAEHPSGYVPAITWSKVEKRGRDGSFVRRCGRGERELVQEVLPDKAALRITFRNIDSTDLAEIVNQVTPADGALQLTLGLTLAEFGSERAVHDPAYLRGIVTDFETTARVMTDRLAATCAAAVGRAAG